MLQILPRNAAIKGHSKFADQIILKVDVGTADQGILIPTINLFVAQVRANPIGGKNYKTTICAIAATIEKDAVRLPSHITINVRVTPRISF